MLGAKLSQKVSLTKDIILKKSYIIICIVIKLIILGLFGLLYVFI